MPQDHLLRKIEKVMDYEWLYERSDPYYCHDNGRPITDPVVLIKIVLIQHLFGIPSLRQTHHWVQDTLSYRWFLGYELLDEIPHFATVSYAFCKRFPEELAQEIFEHILKKASINRVLRHSTTDRDGKRTYRSTPSECVNCPCKTKCGANEKVQNLFTAHACQEYMDLVEQI